MGSARPPSQRAKKASTIALKARLFSDLAKPWPSSGNTALGHRQAQLLLRGDDGVALRQGATHVVRAVADQHRLSDLVGLVERRARAQEGATLLSPYIRIASVKLLHEVGPVRRPILHECD